MTINNPLFLTYFLPLNFPFPALIFFSLFLLSSFSRFKAFRTFSTSLVLSSDSTFDSIISGNIFPNLWPLDLTSSLLSVADNADLIAFLFSLMFIFCDRSFSAFPWDQLL